MLFRVNRLLLALAIALTVPVQGFAAVTAGLCMGHHDGAVHTHEADAAEHHHHDHDSPPASTHCAPCVACCAAAAIAQSMPLVVLDERADAVVAAEPPSFTGIALKTLDRPPLAL